MSIDYTAEVSWEEAQAEARRRAEQTDEAGTGWPDLIPLDAPPLPALPPELLPGWLGDMARAVAIATETPPELAAAFGLAAVAAAVQRVYCVRPEPGYFEPLNVWLLCALEPGNRKTAVQGAMTAPLSEWERDEAEALAPEIARLTSERKTDEARVAKLRTKAAGTDDAGARAELAREIADIEARMPEPATPPRLWAQDITPEHLGTVMHGNAERIATAAAGTRNSTLNAEAHGIAQLAAGGQVDESVALDALAQAAERAGLEPAEVRATLRSAWRAGSRSPRAPEVRT